MSDRSLYITEVYTSDTAANAGQPLTSPSLVFPGTEEAFRRGCKCPAAENIKRLKLGIRPLLLRDCRLHSKICQAEPCGHTDHWGSHMRCEHCTNDIHQCEVCEKVYLEDGDDPTLHGWKFVGNEGVVSDGQAVVRGWRCTECK